jgi:hypothetical protein
MEVSIMSKPTSLFLIIADTLKLTPFRYANIPPPMSRNDLLLQGDLIDVAINSSAGVVVTLQKEVVNIFKYKPRKKFSAEPQHVGSISLPSDCSAWYQIELSENGRIAVLGYIPDQGEKVYACTLGENSRTFVPVTHELDDSNPSALVTTVDGSEVYIQTYKGQSQALSSVLRQTSTSGSLSNHEFCPWMSISVVDDSVSRS